MNALALAALGGMLGLWGAGRLVAAWDDARISEVYSRGVARRDVTIGLAWIAVGTACLALAWALH